MKESYGEGVATHIGPELCVACREAGDEALVGARAGRVLSPESNDDWGADAVGISGRPHPAHCQREMGGDPTGSETSRMHARPALCPERGGLWRAPLGQPPSLQSLRGPSLSLVRDLLW